MFSVSYRALLQCADHYENVYAVVRGTKIFTLLPPQAVFRMDLQPYPTATYRKVGDTLQIELDEQQQEVEWCPVDPLGALGNRQAARVGAFIQPLRLQPIFPELWDVM